MRSVIELRRSAGIHPHWEIKLDAGAVHDLGQSLLQTSKHLGWATRESMEPTQSNKHETHPLDAKSRDDIPLLLINLQAVYTNNAARTELFGLLDEYIIPARGL